MRIPVLCLHHPELELWLASTSCVNSREQLTLVDTKNRHYHPNELRGPLLVREDTCPWSIYDAAQQAGYPVVWIDRY